MTNGQNSGTEVLKSDLRNLSKHTLLPQMLLSADLLGLFLPLTMETMRSTPQEQTDTLHPSSLGQTIIFPWVLNLNKLGLICRWTPYLTTNLCAGTRTSKKGQSGRAIWEITKTQEWSQTSSSKEWYSPSNSSEKISVSPVLVSSKETIQFNLGSSACSSFLLD